MRALAGLAGVAAAATLAAGCGAPTNAPAASPERASVLRSLSADSTDAPSVLPTATERPATGRPAASRPTARGSGPNVPESPGPSRVPGQALLDTTTLGQITGTTWRPAAQPLAVPSCLAGLGHADAVGHAGWQASGDRLTEVVTTQRSAADAGSVVRAATARLPRCGFAVGGAPRLGDAATQGVSTASGQRTTVLLMSAEDATVLLMASGTLPANQDLWDGLADAALGSGCAAQSEGCH